MPLYLIQNDTIYKWIHVCVSTLLHTRTRLTFSSSSKQIWLHGHNCKKESKKCWPQYYSHIKLIMILWAVFSRLHTLQFGIGKISWHHSLPLTHMHTWGPYGCTVKSGVTVSYIRQVSQGMWASWLENKLWLHIGEMLPNGKLNFTTRSFSPGNNGIEQASSVNIGYYITVI